MGHGPCSKNLTFGPGKVFIDFGLRWKVSVRPTCIWYHWKGVSNGTNSISLSYIMANLWCFKDLKFFPIVREAAFI